MDKQNYRLCWPPYLVPDAEMIPDEQVFLVAQQLQQYIRPCQQCCDYQIAINEQELVYSLTITPSGNPGLLFPSSESISTILSSLHTHMLSSDETDAEYNGWKEGEEHNVFATND